MILLLFVLVMTTLSACGKNNAGKINAADSNQKLGALASVVTGPTTTSSLADGLYSPVSVSLSCSGTAGSDCLATYYTIDGTTPNRASTVYTGPIALWSKTTLKYFSIDKAGNVEPVKTQNFLVGSIAISGIKTIAAGWNHTLGIKNDGTLWAWGGNSSGQLGDGTTTDRTLPVQVGAGTTWSAIAAGNSFSLALKSDGTLWAWGANSKGQLGDGTATDQKSPVQIASGTAWSAISAGSSFALALKNDGTLWAWGANSAGQLGVGTIVDGLVPALVSSDTTWSAIAAGYNHAVALKNNGTLWTWGGNSSGQLGNGTINTTPNPIPVQVEGTNWSAISAGGSGAPYTYIADGEIEHVGGHTVALKSDGTLWAWGQNIFGQLGDGTNNQNYYMGWAGAGTYPLREYVSGTDRTLPSQIGTDTDWSMISVGAGHSVALKNDGTLWAWGLNVNGQLANGNAGMNNMLPLPVGADTYLPFILPKRPWASVVAGGYHTLALRSDGTLWSWGWNGAGQLGDGTTISSGGGSTLTTLSNGTLSPTWKLPKFAYVVSDKIYTYTVDYNPGSGSAPGTGSGQLSSTGTPVAAGAQPTSAAMHPLGGFLYVTDSAVSTINGEKISYIHTFAINRNNGALTEVGDTAGVKTLYNPTSITADPLGKFVYVIGTHSKGWQAIAVYTINPASGELTCIGTGVQGAKVMAIEPLGRFAYVIRDVGVTGYSIDQTTGMLTSVIGAGKYDEGDDDLDDAEIYLQSAKYLTVDLSGQFLYVAKLGGSSTPTFDVWGNPFNQINPNSAEVRIYSINHTSGKIFDTNHPLGQTAVSAMAVSPRTGEPYPYQYMYMLFNNNINLMKLDQINGQITDADQSTVSGALGITAEPTGKLVYVLTAGYVKGYAIDPWTGKLQVIGTMASNAGAGGALKTLIFASY